MPEQDKQALAVDNFKRGYNCCQAVLCAFCDEIGMEEETARRLASSFGGGMGRLREVCGAVSAMFMIAGFKFGYSDITDKNAKADHYKLIQKLASEFKQKNESIICRELLNTEGRDTSYVPSERNEAYYKKRPCSEMVRSAAEIVDKLLKE